MGPYILVLPNSRGAGNKLGKLLWNCKMFRSFTSSAFERDKDEEYNMSSVLPNKRETCVSVILQTGQCEPNVRNRNINTAEVPIHMHQQRDERQGKRVQLSV
jgi:hypothetical protein